MRYSGRMRRRYRSSVWLVASILLTSCSSQRIVPDSIEPLVNGLVSFRDVGVPSFDRQQSQGRFFTLRQEFLDPATMAKRMRVTIVGEVSGVKTDRLDGGEYRDPTLIVKHLHVWPLESYGRW